MLFLGIFFLLCEKEKLPKENKSLYELILNYDKKHDSSISYFYANAMERLKEFYVKRDTIVIKEFSKDGKNFYIFGCYHNSRKAIVNFIKKVLVKIENPEEWVFLVEGTGHPFIFLPEIMFFYQVAEDLEIPIEDPVISVIDKEVLDSLTQGVHSVITLRDIFYTIFYEVHPDPTFYLEIPTKRKERLLTICSRFSGVPKDSVETFFIEYIKYFGSNPNRVRMAKEYFNQLKRDIIKMSNKLSLKKAKKIIQKYKDKKYVFVYVGLYHLPVFEEI